MWTHVSPTVCIFTFLILPPFPPRCNTTLKIEGTFKYFFENVYLGLQVSFYLGVVNDFWSKE